MRSELKQFQMLKARLRKYHRLFATPISICPYDPPRNAITFKKRATKGLTVPSVEQFSGNKPPNRSGKGPIKDDAERIVEPKRFLWRVPKPGPGQLCNFRLPPTHPHLPRCSQVQGTLPSLSSLDPSEGHQARCACG